MISATRAAIRRWLEHLLHIHDSPQRTAAAYAVGVMFGFSPLLGLHTVLALGVAFLFNLNRVAVLLGVYSNLPWIIAPYYTLVTVGGAALLGTRIPPGFETKFRNLFELSLFHGVFWVRLYDLLRPLFWSYVVGSTVGALLLGAIAYRAALAFVIAERRTIEHHRHHHPHPDGSRGRQC